MLWQARRGLISGRGALDAAAGGGHGSNAANYLARTSGLDSTHTNAFGDYIDGLDTDNLFSKFDVLGWFAHQDATNAVLNLISSSFATVLHGSPSFTADRGYTGVDGSSTVYADTTFNPTTATSPKATQNSMHLSAWCLNNINSGSPVIGANNNGITESDIYPRFNSDNKFYARIQGAGATGFTNASGIGQYLATRSSSGGGVDGYKDGASAGNTSGASQPLQNLNIIVLGLINNITGVRGSAFQVAMFSIGSNLTSTDATNFYNRNRTLGTALGIP